MYSQMQPFFNRDLSGKRILVLGAGYVGRALAERAHLCGASITLYTRTRESAAELRASGFDARGADIVRDAAWAEDLKGFFDLVLLAVSTRGGDAEAYRETYLGSAESLAQWLVKAKPGAVIYTSSCSVYPQRNGERVDEGALLDPQDLSPKARILFETEKRMLGADNGAQRRFVLRLAGIYGPERHLLLDRVLEGTPTLPGRGNQYLNLIHREDIVSAILALAFSSGDASSGIYNVADDGHATRADIVAWAANRLSLPVPAFDPLVAGRRNGEANRIILNDKLKKTTGWTPRYPSFREGYEEILSRSET